MQVGKVRTPRERGESPAPCRLANHLKRKETACLSVRLLSSSALLSILSLPTPLSRSGEENISVIVAPIFEGFNLGAMGAPDAVAQQFINMVSEHWGVSVNQSTGISSSSSLTWRVGTDAVARQFIKMVSIGLSCTNSGSASVAGCDHM